MNKNITYSFQEIVEHYIKYDKRKERKTSVTMIFLPVIFLGTAIFSFVYIRNSENFNLVFYLTSIIGVLSLWFIIYSFVTTSPLRPLNKHTLYNILIENPNTIVKVYEHIHFEHTSFFKSRIVTDYKLPWQNSIVTIENRINFIEKHPNVEVLSRFIFIFDQNKIKVAKLELPSNEGPIFSAMLEKAMPNIKFGYEEGDPVL